MIIKPFNYSFSIENQLHVLSHFHHLDAHYKNTIQKYSTHSLDEINAELNREGSKFNSNFAGNPLVLLTLLKSEIEDGNYRSIDHSGGKIDFIIQFDKAIGTSGIIKIDDLTEEEVRSLKMIKYRNANILKATINRTIPTKQVNLVTRLKNDSYEIITVFPGIYAPSLPDKGKQSKDEYMESRGFWDKYVFV